MWTRSYAATCPKHTASQSSSELFDAPDTRFKPRRLHGMSPAFIAEFRKIIFACRVSHGPCTTQQRCAVFRADG